MDNKCEHQAQMEEMGFNNESLFELSFCKLDHLSKELTNYIDIKNTLCLDAFLLRQIRKMLDIWESIHILHNSNKNQSSLLALSRVTIDHFAVINLIYYQTKDEYEQILRLCLYVLDGITGRCKSLKKRKPKFDERYITKHEFDKTEQQCSSAIKSDEAAIKSIMYDVETNPIYQNVNRRIISELNWRYKNIKSNSRYSWVELYNLFDTHEAADNYQNYLSHFVHGLGISDFQYDPDKKNELDYSIGLAITIIDRTTKLLSDYFDTVIKDNNIDFSKNRNSNVILRYVA